MTSLIAAGGSGRSTSVIPAVPAASSVTTIAFISHLPVSSFSPAGAGPTIRASKTSAPRDDTFASAAALGRHEQSRCRATAASVLLLGPKGHATRPVPPGCLTRMAAVAEAATTCVANDSSGYFGPRNPYVAKARVGLGTVGRAKQSSAPPPACAHGGSLRSLTCAATKQPRTGTPRAGSPTMRAWLRRRHPGSDC
jgi:hypothetical protein